MTEREFIEELKSYLELKLLPTEIESLKIKEQPYGIFLLGEFKKFNCSYEIVVRGSYNTDFNIFSWELEEQVYTDFLFYGADGEIKFSKEQILISWIQTFETFWSLQPNRK